MAAPERKMGTPECMCGYCHTAWDIIMGRARPYDKHSHAFYWLLKCRFGGCDPQCWDCVGEDGSVTHRPTFSTRWYHLRDKNVPWNMETRPRRVSQRELMDMDVAVAKKKKADMAMFEDDPDEMEWV